jgi:integrase
MTLSITEFARKGGYARAKKNFSAKRRQEDCAFTDAGVGNKMRDWCDQAGLHHCSAHGLRKAGATLAANHGATSRQLMAIFGWDSIKQAEQYTRAADQIGLAEGAMHMLEPTDPNQEQT